MQFVSGPLLAVMPRREFHLLLRRRTTVDAPSAEAAAVQPSLPREGGRGFEEDAARVQVGMRVDKIIFSHLRKIFTM